VIGGNITGIAMLNSEMASIPSALLATADEVNRIILPFVAVHESVCGTFRTQAIKLTVSVHRGRADISYA
jgi:hypothetical protein